MGHILGCNDTIWLFCLFVWNTNYFPLALSSFGWILRQTTVNVGWHGPGCGRLWLWRWLCTGYVLCEWWRGMWENVSDSTVCYHRPWEEVQINCIIGLFYLSDYILDIKWEFYLTRMLEDDHPASQAELFGNCPS